MPRLQIFVTAGCFGCEEARRLWQVVDRLPAIDVQLVDIETVRALPERVVAVPTYLLDGKVVALGNPEQRALFARLATAVFSGRAPLLLASGALVGNLLACLVLVVFAGVCLSVGAFQVEVPVDPMPLALVGAGALFGAAALVSRAIWALRHPLVLDEAGSRKGRTRIRWADVSAVEERFERQAGLEVVGRDGRRLRIARDRLDPRTYAELHPWLVALTTPPPEAPSFTDAPSVDR